MAVKAHIEALANHHAQKIMTSTWIEEQLAGSMKKLGGSGILEPNITKKQPKQRERLSSNQKSILKKSVVLSIHQSVRII